ncbi:MAG: hypothetical protein ACI97N_000122 [Cognaticolwellia sp.]|jgi:hypothetical protein
MADNFCELGFFFSQHQKDKKPQKGDILNIG